MTVNFMTVKNHHNRPYKTIIEGLICSSALSSRIFGVRCFVPKIIHATKYLCNLNETKITFKIVRNFN